MASPNDLGSINASLGSQPSTKNKLQIQRFCERICHNVDVILAGRGTFMTSYFPRGPLLAFDPARLQRLQTTQQTIDHARIVLENTASSAVDVAIAKSNVASSIKALRTRDHHFAGFYMKTAASRMELNDFIKAVPNNQHTSSSFHPPSKAIKQRRKVTTALANVGKQAASCSSQSPVPMTEDASPLLAPHHSGIQTVDHLADSQILYHGHNTETRSPRSMAIESSALHHEGERARVGNDASDNVQIIASASNSNPGSDTRLIKSEHMAEAFLATGGETSRPVHHDLVSAGANQPASTDNENIFTGRSSSTSAGNIEHALPTSFVESPATTYERASPASFRRGASVYLADTGQRQETSSRSSFPQSPFYLPAQQTAPRRQQMPPHSLYSMQSRRRLLELELRGVNIQIELCKMEQEVHVSGRASMEPDISNT
jgi:hypothetical protein